MEQKKAWIYCRVAHNGPDSTELLAAQRSRLEAYAKEHGFEVVGTSSDIASGLKFDHRPGLLEFHNGRWMEMLTFCWSVTSPGWAGIWTGPCNTGICSVISLSASTRRTAVKWI